MITKKILKKHRGHVIFLDGIYYRYLAKCLKFEILVPLASSSPSKYSYNFTARVNGLVGPYVQQEHRIKTERLKLANQRQTAPR